MKIMILHSPWTHYDYDDFSARSWIDEGLKTLDNESYIGEAEAEPEPEVNNNFHVSSISPSAIMLTTVERILKC